MKKTVYEKIYEKLEKLNILKIEAYQKRQSGGLMDLHIDVLEEDEKTKKIALAHNYIQNGDVMADPDMEIRIHKELKMAEALTFQNDGLGIFQRVYIERDGKKLVNVKLKKDLNKFLNQWLTNIINQKYTAVKGDN